MSFPITSTVLLHPTRLDNHDTITWSAGDYKVPRKGGSYST